MKEDRSAFKILISTPTGRRPLGKPRRWWEDNIRMDVKEIETFHHILIWYLFYLILRKFENRILRQIFGHKKDENGNWRRLHNEKLHSFNRSPNIVRVIKSRRLRWAGHVARMEECRSAFKILTGRPTSAGKWPLGRRRNRWEDNIRMDLKEIGINKRNWVDSAQDRHYWRTLVNAALNFRVLYAM